MGGIKPIPTTPADRWEELFRSGMTADAATAQVRREYPASVLSNAMSSLSAPPPAPKPGLIESTLRAASTAPNAGRRAAMAKAEESLRPTVGSTAANLATNAAASLVIPAVSERLDQKALDQAAAAGIDVSKHANLFGAASAGGLLTGLYGLGEALPAMPGLSRGMNAKQVFGTLAKGAAADAAMGGALAVPEAAMSDAPLKEKAKYIGQNAAQWALFGTGMRGLTGAPVLRDAVVKPGIEAVADASKKAGVDLRSEVGAVGRQPKPNTPEDVRSAMGGLMEKPPAKEPPKPPIAERLKAELGSAYQSLINNVHAAERFGVEVAGTETVKNAAANARGWRGRADWYIGLRGPTEPAPPGTPPTLMQTMTAARGIEAPVAELATARNAIRLADAGYASKGVDIAKAKEAVKRLSADPEVTAAADQLHAFYRRLWDDRLAEGLISAETHAAAVARGDYYTPFVREWAVERGPGQTPGGRLYQGRGSRRMKQDQVASAPIVNPYEQAVRDAQSTAQDIGRQRAANAIGDVLEAFPVESSPYLIDHGPMEAGWKPAPGQGDNIITPIINGMKRRIEVTDPDLLAALQSTSPAQRQIGKTFLRHAGTALRAGKSALQTGVTSHPLFSLFNFTRDQGFSLLSMKFPAAKAGTGAAIGAGIGAYQDKEDRLRGAFVGGLTGAAIGVWGQQLKQTVSGLQSVLKYDNLYQDWIKEGGSGMGFYVRTPKDAQKVVQQLQRKAGGWKGKILNPKSWWDTFKFINEAVEQGTRVGKFKTELKAGASMPEATAASRDISVDFQRAGAHVGPVRETVAFWNPAIQGLDKVRRTLSGKDKANAIAMGAVGLTAPSIALWWMNHNDPAYQEIPVWERNLFWLVPNGKDETGRTQFLRVPKPFEPGYVFASIPERLLDFAYQKDPEKLNAAMLDMLRNTVGGVAMPIPTLIKPFYEAYLRAPPLGYDSFRGTSVVPRGMENLPAEQQVNPRTTAAARLAGKAGEVTGVPISPIKIDHIIRGNLGPVTSMALEGVADPILRGLGLDNRPTPPTQGLLEGSRLMAHNTGFGADDVQAMYRHFDKAEEARNGLRNLAKGGDRKAVEAFRKKHQAELTEYTILNDYVTKYRQLAKARRNIEANRTMTGDEKRAEILRLGALAEDVARRAVAAVQ